MRFERRGLYSLFLDEFSKEIPKELVALVVACGGKREKEIRERNGRGEYGMSLARLG